MIFPNSNNFLESFKKEKDCANSVITGMLNDDFFENYEKIENSFQETLDAFSNQPSKTIAEYKSEFSVLLVFQVKKFHVLSTMVTDQG